MCDAVLSHSFFSDWCLCPSLILHSLSVAANRGCGDSDPALSLLSAACEYESHGVECIRTDDTLVANSSSWRIKLYCRRRLSTFPLLGFYLCMCDKS